MAPLCLLYFAAFAAAVGAAALLAERALARTGTQRWPWLAAIAMSMVLPPFFSAHHSSHLVGPWGLAVLRLPSSDAHAAHAAAGAASAGPAWMDCSAPHWQLVLWIWLPLSAGLILWTLAGAWRTARLSRPGSHRAGDSEVTERTVDGVDAVVTSSLGPATVGCWRARVVIPRWVLALPPAQRRYVLRHEDEHRRARDTLLIVAASVAVVVMPWNLPLWWQLRRLRLAVELDCDHRVVRALGDAHEYASLLLKVAEASSRSMRLQPALVGGPGTLERRLASLLTAPTRSRTLLASVLALVLLATVLSVPHPQLARATTEHAPAGAPVARQ